MSSRWRWILIVTAATALDLLARFGASFNFDRVMHIEAVLFPVTGAVLATLFRREPSTQGWSHAVRVGLIWLFILGGLRPLLWTLGLSLMTANLATLIVTLTGILIWVLRRRHGVLGGSATLAMAEQPTPRVSRDDVERVVRRDFPAADYATVLTVLGEYGNEAGERDNARVQLAALKLALGDLKELRRHIGVARQDYRDVLSAAEYPVASIRWSAMGSLSEKERQNIYDSDWDQYQQWLERR